MANPNPDTSHLVPYQPGQSGNPGGRPKKRILSESYDELLREPLPEHERKALGLPPGTTWARAISLARGRHALTRAGVLSAKEMREATEGKASQRIELSSPEDRGFEVVVTFEMPAGKQLEDKTINVKPLPEKSEDAPAE